MKAGKATTILILTLLLTHTALARDETDLMHQQQKEATTMFGSFIEKNFISFWHDLQWNPTLYCEPTNPSCETTGNIDKLTGNFIEIMIPFYIVAVLFCALFFILKSGSPRGRARARSMIIKLLLGTVVVVLAPMLYQALIDFSEKLVKWILNTEATSINVLGFFELDLGQPFSITPEEFKDLRTATVWGGMLGSCFLTPVACIILFIARLVLFWRFLMILFYGVFFPFIVALYSFDLTRGYGQKWLSNSLKWIFTPVLQALILVVIISIINDFNATGMPSVSKMLSFMSVMAGLILFAAAPLLKGGVLGWVGAGIAAVGLGSGRVWMVAAGGILQGQGPSSLPLAHGEFAHEASFERMMALGTGVAGGKVMPGFTRPDSLMGRSGGSLGGDASIGYSAQGGSYTGGAGGDTPKTPGRGSREGRSKSAAPGGRQLSESRSSLGGSKQPRRALGEADGRRNVKTAKDFVKAAMDDDIQKQTQQNRARETPSPGGKGAVDWSQVVESYNQKTNYSEQDTVVSGLSKSEDMKEGMSPYKEKTAEKEGSSESTEEDFFQSITSKPARETEGGGGDYISSLKKELSKGKGFEELRKKYAEGEADAKKTGGKKDLGLG
ncbi:MAG: hypothetical protein GF334_04005, partial [Candidatus Altiarchaeales archaeon]|nr:hypothetical protein [Candidatus Altiarchaeales archaeon]